MHVSISGRILSGTIEAATDGDLLRCESADWKAAGLQVGQVVAVDSRFGPAGDRVVRSVMPAGDGDVWVWLGRVPADPLGRHTNSTSA